VIHLKNISRASESEYNKKTYNIYAYTQKQVKLVLYYACNAVTAFILSYMIPKCLETLYQFIKADELVF
jgi:hypothetical protein